MTLSLPCRVKLTTPLPYQVQFLPHDCVRIVVDGEEDGDAHAFVEAGSVAFGGGEVRFVLRRDGDGNGDCVVDGPGWGDAVRAGGGRGNAVRDGDGDGDAWHRGDGCGDAVRAGAGDGNAWRFGRGAGEALRLGAGAGEGRHWGRERAEAPAP